jgi:hypothetical protein
MLQLCIWGAIFATLVVALAIAARRELRRDREISPEDRAEREASWDAEQWPYGGGELR